MYVDHLFVLMLTSHATLGGGSPTRNAGDTGGEHTLSLCIVRPASETAWIEP